MSFQKIEAIGVYPPQPSLNTDNNQFFDQSVFVPRENQRDIPLALKYGGGVFVRSERPFVSQVSGKVEVPFIVMGPTPKAVAERVKSIFELH